MLTKKHMILLRDIIDIEMQGKNCKLHWSDASRAEDLQSAGLVKLSWHNGEEIVKSTDLGRSEDAKYHSALKA